RAGELVAASPDMPLRQVAQAAGISVGTARDVRLRVLGGEDPVPRQQRARAERGQDLAGPRRPGTRAEPLDEVDCHTLLENLKKDPSLRYNEAGRTILRWLNLRVVRGAELGDLVD